MASHLSRSVILAAALASFVAPLTTVFAAEPASSTHDQALQTPAGKFIEDLGNRAINVISNKQMAQGQRDQQYSQILGDSFDLKTIGRFVIGSAWATATPQQQDEYMNLFKSLVIRNYGDRMSLASGEKFLVTGTRPESDEDTTVLSQVTHPDGSQSTEIDWRVRDKGGKQAVIDVVVAGVSLSVTQRQEYASIIQSSGGQIDGLLQAMKKQLGGAAPAAQ